MNHLNKVTVELKLKIFLMLNFEMEKEEAIQIGDLDKKYSAAQRLQLMDPLALNRISNLLRTYKKLTFRRWCWKIKLIVLYVLMFVRRNTVNAQL